MTLKPTGKSLISLIFLLEITMNYKQVRISQSFNLGETASMLSRVNSNIKPKMINLSLILTNIKKIRLLTLRSQKQQVMSTFSSRSLKQEVHTLRDRARKDNQKLKFKVQLLACLGVSFRSDLKQDSARIAILLFYQITSRVQAASVLNNLQGDPD